MRHPTIALLCLLALFNVTAAAAITQPPGQGGPYTPERGYTGNLTLLGRSDEPDAQSVRQFFLKLVQRPPAPVALESRLLDESGGIRRSYFSYAREPGRRVPGLWYQPARSATPLPVVIILHGTGGNKEGMKPHLETYARAGFAAIAIDAPYHGERSAAGKGSAEYQEAILSAWRKPGREHPFFYDTVWDVMRLLDLLETSADLDPKRIGLTGFSKGGIETYLAAALDRRIAAAVPYIGVQSFGWALENNAWQSRVSTIQKAVDAAAKESGVAEINAAFIRKFYLRVAPGIDGLFDGPRVLPLIAPRPLLVINGDSDPRTPMPAVEACVQLARQEYGRVGAAGRLEFIAQKDTAHKVTPEAHAAGLAWFKQWLQPQPISAPPSNN